MKRNLRNACRQLAPGVILMLAGSIGVADCSAQTLRPLPAPEADVNTAPLPSFQPKQGPAIVGAAVYNRDIELPNEGFARRTAYTIRDGEVGASGGNGIYPIPLGGELRQDDPRYGHRHDNRASTSEFIYDGSDRGKRVQVDGDWNVYGMDTEDTFGHFDTVTGRRLVSPSNRVAIYAPRFAAVRRVDKTFKAQLTQKVSSFDRKEQILTNQGQDFSSTTKQHVAADGFKGSARASGIVDRTRGVGGTQVLTLRGARDSFAPYENLDLIRWGRTSNSESARLDIGLQAANVWQDNLGLQVSAKKVQPVIVNDTYRVQQLVVVETDGDNAILRVAKVASRIAARPGETVEFTIRFDNLSARKIGNVTIVDNLTGRLQYVADSAECSLEGKFVQEENDGGSLMLRWEIEEPIPAGKGGIIRFTCRVR